MRRPPSIAGVEFFPKIKRSKMTAPSERHIRVMPLLRSWRSFGRAKLQRFRAYGAGEPNPSAKYPARHAGGAERVRHLDLPCPPPEKAAVNRRSPDAPRGLQTLGETFKIRRVASSSKAPSPLRSAGAVQNKSPRSFRRGDWGLTGFGGASVHASRLASSLAPPIMISRRRWGNPRSSPRSRS